MTLHASGVPMGLGGSTSGQSVNLELGHSATATIGMDTAAVRTLAGAGASPASYSMAQFYGKSARNQVSLTISVSTLNYVLNTAKCGTYASGTTDVTLTINSGVTLGSSSTSTAALIVDTSWAAGDTVTVVNNGSILGCGGNGGNGGVGSGAAATAGSAGGPAVTIQRATTIQNNGIIGGGGGGGGGGAA